MNDHGHGPGMRCPLCLIEELQARVAELEAREKRIRDAAFHPLFNSVEARATIRTILNLAPNA